MKGEKVTSWPHSNNNKRLSCFQRVPFNKNSFIEVFFNLYLAEKSRLRLKNGVFFFKFDYVFLDRFKGVLS
jgi:hypothetical protein